MKSFTTAAAIAGLASVAQAAVPGFDISGWQDSTDFAKAYADGDRFVYIKVRSCAPAPPAGGSNTAF